MKKILFIFLILFSVLGIDHILEAAASKPTTLVIHYYRYDDNYTNYAFHMWEYLPTSKTGIDFSFDNSMKDDNGVYFEMNLLENFTTATTLGIIIKSGMGWDNVIREPGGDRYIDLSKVEVINGVAHAYFVQGSIEFGLSNADLAAYTPDYRPKILSAMFNTSYQVVASLTSLPEGGYTVYENDVVIKTGAVTSTSLNIPLTNVDISKVYTLSVEFTQDRVHNTQISIQNLYDTAAFESAYTYDGQLGVIVDTNQTTFRLWAPLSASVTLNLYHQNHPNYDNSGNASNELTPYQTITLEKIENGAWEAVVPSNLNGTYYTYSVTNNGVTYEVVDPYAYSTGANGLRGLVLDFDTANPNGWTYNTRPNTVTNATDYIVYELHVRDLTSHSSWGGNPDYAGTFLGLAQSGTRYTNALGVTVTTGLDHMAELGINAVQLLPIFDYGYIDEVAMALDPAYSKTFNWGYMPYNFNTLEGSFSTNPFDGSVRVNEFKQAVMALGNKDIRVIMDVVYNHTGESDTGNFERIIPGYYHRMTSTGSFSNGSGTGNETASERSMMQKFMVDSVKFWATEYNLSGFRFDLMALHDVETMNKIEEALHQIDPTIVVYGEPWNGGTTTLPASMAASKDNLDLIDNVGAFNDVSRDGIKGSVFTANEGGWIQGNTTDYNVNRIRYGILGGIDSNLTTETAWHLEPTKIVNYVSAHDNNTLYDKLKLTGVSSTIIKDVQIQANAIVLMSQGISFLHAGVDFMRSKPKTSGGYDSNSYESPDSVNQLRWDRKATYLDVFNYYKDLIQIRKDYRSLRMTTSTEIASRITFLDTNQGTKAIAYKIAGTATDPEMIIIHSQKPTGGLTMVELTPGITYKVLTTYQNSDPNGIETVTGTALVLANTTMILVAETNPITIKSDLVQVSNGSTYDPSKNIIQNETGLEINYSTFHETSTPGFYLVTVSVKQAFGKVTYYHYMLQVTGGRFDVIINGGN